MRRIRTIMMAGLVPAIVTIGGPAVAEMASAYQDITAKACKDMNPRPPKQRADHDIVPYVCPKFAGYGVGFTQFPASLQFRIDPPGGKSDEPQIRMLSGLGEKLEWRGEKQGSTFAPKAAIVRSRWFGNGAAPDASVLNILKIEPGRVCLAAVVDASAHRNANEIARAAADGPVQAFNCAEKPVILGQHTQAAKDARDGAF